MFNETVTAKLKELVKAHKTTQANLVNALVEQALATVDLNNLQLEPAKKRGRKPEAKAEEVRSE